VYRRREKPFLILYFWMLTNSSAVNSKALSIRSNIKAAIAQLDQWDALQVSQRRRRLASNARFRSFDERLAVSKHRAKQTFPFQVGDPVCDTCDSPFHSTGSCDVSDVLDALEHEDQINSTSGAQVHEDPSSGIQRAIIHRVYLEACSLYRLLHPRFYPGVQPRFEPAEVFPVPLSGPDYLSIAISQASSDFLSLPFGSSDIRNQSASCSVIAQLYYSKAFPIAFGDFCERVADTVEEARETLPVVTH
jgi:hypothetical protein